MIAVSRSYARNNRYFEVILFGIILFVLVISIFSLLGNIVPEKGNTITYHRVIVQQGDTLWALAANSNTGADINRLVNKTMEYNNLSSTFIQPGQVIYVPVRG